MRATSPRSQTSPMRSPRRSPQQSPRQCRPSAKAKRTSKDASSTSPRRSRQTSERVAGVPPLSLKRKPQQTAAEKGTPPGVPKKVSRAPVRPPPAAHKAAAEATSQISVAPPPAAAGVAPAGTSNVGDQQRGGKLHAGPCKPPARTPSPSQAASHIPVRVHSTLFERGALERSHSLLFVPAPPPVAVLVPTDPTDASPGACDGGAGATSSLTPLLAGLRPSLESLCALTPRTAAVRAARSSSRSAASSGSSSDSERFSHLLQQSDHRAPRAWADGADTDGAETASV
jgi:hypothetical protein